MHCLARALRSGTPADFHSDNSRRKHEKGQKRVLEKVSVDRLAKEAKSRLYTHTQTHATWHTPHTCQKSCREGGAHRKGEGG